MTVTSSGLHRFIHGDDRLPATDGTEALIPEARARQQRRRKVAVILSLASAAVAAAIYGVAQTISDGSAAPPCAPGSCLSVIGADQGNAASVALYGIYPGASRMVPLRPNGYTQVEAAQLERVNPRTLTPLGRGLHFPNGFNPWAFSPGGAELVGSGQQPTGLVVVSLKSMSINSTVDTRIDAILGQRSVRAVAWLTPTSIVVVAESFTAEARHVKTRSLIAFNPVTGRVDWQHTLSHTLALFGAQPIGGKLVLQLGDSLLQSTRQTIIVVSPNGQLRSTQVTVPRVEARFQTATLATMQSPSPAAYLVSEGNTIFSINLTTSQATPHRVAPPANASSAPLPVHQGFYPRATQLGESIVAAGLFTRNGKPRGGLYLINPTTWSARLIDPATTVFKSNGTVLAATSNPPTSNRALSLKPGSGITLYNQSGEQIGHLYGTTTLEQITLTRTFGYAYAPTYKTSRRHGHEPVAIPTGGRQLLFNPATGTSLGRTPYIAAAPQLIYPGAP
jgi:hypothetical protein